MILDNSVAGLINLNLVNQQKVRAAGCFPLNYNDYGAHFLMGSPKDDQTLEDVEKLLLEQIEQVKNGEFEDWILPAVINDFKKKTKRRFRKQCQAGRAHERCVPCLCGLGGDERANRST